MSQATQLDVTGSPSSPPPNVEALEELLVEELHRVPSGSSSNFAAMCETLEYRRLLPEKCDACDGRGYQDIDQDAIDRRERQIAWYTDPEERRRRRAQLKMGRECRKCAGTGEAFVIGAETLCDVCLGAGELFGARCRCCVGTGRLTLGPVDSMFTTARCPRCDGTSEVLDDDAEDACPLCLANSYVVPCTVRPTGSSKKGKGAATVGALEEPGSNAGAVGWADGSVSWADEQEIALGSESRLLDGVRMLDPGAAEVLSTFHGPGGDRWAKHHWGRGFVLWHMTRSGRLAIDDALKRPASQGGHWRGMGHLANPAEVLARERMDELESKVPNLRRRALLTAADNEHRQLLASARRVLGEVVAR